MRDREHLKRDRPRLYRWMLPAGALGVIVTLLVGNVGLATVLAALVVPIVSVAFIYHSTREPAPALVAMALSGGLAGAGLALLTRLYLEQLPLAQRLAMAQGGPPLSVTLLLGVTLPLLGELAKMAGPLLLRRWPRFRDEVMDGAVLGMVSGVGFAAASTLVNYWPIIRDGYAPMGASGTSEWAATLVGLAIVRPLVHGATGGLIAAGIWAATRRRGSVTVPVVVGLGGSVAYSLGEQLVLRWGTPAVLALHVLVLAVLLVTLRRTIARGPGDRAPAPTLFQREGATGRGWASLWYALRQR
jgi:RsiW-degrading membrane proteinase PrsW (M82 family)